MSDKSHGGARAGSGRKPKADEIKLIEQMDSVMLPDSVWLALSGKVEDGDVMAIKTWLGYRYGMPKQMVINENINYKEEELTSKKIEEIKNKINNAY